MKIITLLLSALIIFNMICIPVNADDNIVSDVESYVEFLGMLGITDGIETDDLTKTVSRAEFASLAVNMTNLSTVVTDAEDFSDVDISEGFGPKIYDALYLGLVSESPEGLFYPDNEIAYEAAVKMVIEGLGYGKKASLYGGYPSGYIRVANELDILSGVGSAMKLSDAITLVTNALLCEVWIVDAVSGDNIEYRTQKGRTLLIENFNLKHTEGIVYTAGIYSANYGYDSVAASIEISNRKYDCSIDDIEKYLGYHIDAWYDVNDRVVAVLPSNNNNEITIPGKDVLEYSNRKLTVESGNKEKDYKLSNGYTYILNGRLYNQNDSDFMFKNGNLILLDNNADGVYDFVKAERYDFFKVTSIDELSRIIYDNTVGNNNIDFSTSTDSHYEFNLYNVSKDRHESATFDDITVGSLLEIKQSGDGHIKSVTILTGNGVSGKIEELGNDYVVMNGTDYELSDYFVSSSGEILKAGMTASFLVSSNKSIVVKTDSASSMLYGYYLDFKKSVGFEKAQIKLLSTDNAILVYPVADKVKVNNSSALVEADNLYSQLIYTASDTPIYQVIKYRVNKDGELCAIDFAADALIGGTIVTDGIDGDSLIKYVDKQQFMYKEGQGLIVPFGKVASHTAVFSVPFELRNEGNTGFIYERYGDDSFLCVGTSRLSNDLKGTNVAQEDYRIDVYDYNKNRIPSVITVYDVTGSGDQSKKINPIYSAESNMVENVTTACDDDGNVTIKIYLCALSGYKSYIVNYEVYEEIKSANSIPARGDIIRYSLNSKNEIVGIARDIVPSTDKKRFTINFEDATGEDTLSSNISYRFTYGVGKVNSLGDGLLTLEFIETPISWGTNVSATDKLPFSTGATKAVLYSGEKNPIRVINVSDIKTEANCGVGDIIVGRLSYYHMTTIFVYRAE